LTHSHCYVLKLHGDYKDARILNTDQELSAYPDGYNRLLDRIFDEHGLIICGWSGEWDHVCVQPSFAHPTGAIRSIGRRAERWIGRARVGDTQGRKGHSDHWCR
jgi:hypothetical protein